MSETFKAIRRYIQSKKDYENFLDFDSEHFAKIMKLFDSGCCFPLPERDSEGRRIILIIPAKWDSEIFSPYDFARLIIYVKTILLEEEKTQIAGISFIIDNVNISTRHSVSPVFVKECIDLMIKCSPVRYKNVYVLNLPSVAKVMFDFVLSMMSKKIAARICSLDDSSKLKYKIDQRLLPKDYGGTETSAEMMKKFLLMHEERCERVLEYLTYKIDWTKIPSDFFDSNEEKSGIGSFRKLEID